MFYVLLYTCTTLKADLNCCNFNIGIFLTVNISTFVFEGTVMRQNVACGLSRFSNRPRVAYLVLFTLSHMDSDVGQIFPTAS